MFQQIAFSSSCRPLSCCLVSGEDQWGQVDPDQGALPTLCCLACWEQAQLALAHQEEEVVEAVPQASHLRSAPHLQLTVSVYQKY